MGTTGRVTRELALLPSYFSKQAGGIKRENTIKVTDDNAPRVLPLIHTHNPSQQPETQPMTAGPPPSCS